MTSTNLRRGPDLEQAQSLGDGDDRAAGLGHVPIVPADMIAVTATRDEVLAAGIPRPNHAGVNSVRVGDTVVG